MEKIADILKKNAVAVPEILLPAAGTDMTKWAVVACDQYTSQKEYWTGLKDLIADAPSTLNCIFPECYLEDGDEAERIKSINSHMNNYIDSGVLGEPVPGFILVKRETPSSAPRWGLMVSLDLEMYDFSVGSVSAIRATEGTILERIPPRVRIRENAPIELPHIMVLIDDPEKSLIEPLSADTESLEKVYDFELNNKSGHLTGYRINSQEKLEQIAAAFEKLGSADTAKKMYGTENRLLFAMGDGNHSLATAKTIWEDYKKNNASDPQLMSNPARWALVEIENIYCEGIEFEAIHRILFGLDYDNFVSAATTDGSFSVTAASDFNEALSLMTENAEVQRCAFVTDKGAGVITARKPDSSIAAGTFQNFLDAYLEKNADTKIDYVHGLDVTEEIGSKSGNMGIALPSIAKDSFFRTVINDGAFPRKTFSMGEAFEKRFYVEARKIKK